jgi:hypothetical protein
MNDLEINDFYQQRTVPERSMVIYLYMGSWCKLKMCKSFATRFVQAGVHLVLKQILRLNFPILMFLVFETVANAIRQYLPIQNPALSDKILRKLNNEIP